MVAFLDSSDDSRYGGFWAGDTPTLPWTEQVAVRLEKVSAACEAIRRDHYDRDDNALDIALDLAVERVSRSVIPS